MACPIHIISGFLGSGKTTLLNEWIKSVDKNIGIIVNDFGSVCIDGSLIESSKTNIVKQTNLSGGQIFCSCLSGSFVSSIKDYSNLNLDLLLVEASGLAKPSTMVDILSEVFKAEDFVFGSYITVVDATSFIELVSVINAIPEQIVTADTIIITKTDIASKSKIMKTQDIIKELNPNATILESDKGKTNFTFLEKKYAFGSPKTLGKDFRGWGNFHRPKPTTLHWTNSISKEKLDKFINLIITNVLRAKGFVNIDGDGTWKIDVAQQNINNEKFSKQKEESYIVVIRQESLLSDDFLVSTAQDLFGGKVWIDLS